MSNKAVVKPDFETLFDSAPDLYLVLNPNLDIVAASEAFLQATATRRADIVGRNVFDVFPDGPGEASTDPAHLRASLHRVIESHAADTMAVQRREVRRSESEGGGLELRYWSPVNFPILNPDGSLANIIHRMENVTELVLLKQQRVDQARLTDALRERAGTAGCLVETQGLDEDARLDLLFANIAERQRAEEALRRSESQVRTLGNNLPEAAIYQYRVDADGRPHVDFVSDGIERLTGIPAAEFMNDATTLERSVLEEDLDRIHAAIAASRANLTRFETEVRHRHRITGEIRWSLLRSTPSRSPDGSTTWDGIELDITERKRSEEALADAMQRLNAHMDNSPLAVVEFDRRFRVTRWSKEAERLFGWRPDEILGRTAAEMQWVYEDDVEAVAQISHDMVAGRRGRNLSRNRNYRKDGSVIECEWYNSAIYDAEGKLASMLCQVLDVTERKRAEERLRDAQKLESLGLLAGGVAHDFNNLLVGVIGNASLAQELLPPDNPAADLLQGVIRTGEQAAHLTRQMLAYSGKGRFVMEALDLSALIPEMSNLVRPSISKKIELNLDVAADLPHIQADRGQIQQVFLNLVLNASEAIGSQDGVISVRTGVQDVDDRYQRLHPEAAELAPGRYVFLEVRDNGCGMAEATRIKIFDPFFTTKFTGRGLGLAAVAGIVRGHKGAIAVISAEGKGSCFIVLFPASACAAEPPPATVPGTTVQGAGVVLVVDDEPVVRELAKSALERYGFTVLLADSGLSAVDVCKRPGEIALVLLDLSMPHMSGAEALPELRKIRPDVKVVVSSGYSEAETMTLFAGQPVSGFIQKPYTSKGIAEKVKACIG